MDPFRGLGMPRIPGLTDLLGLLQTVGAVKFPAFNDTLIFLLMIIVLLVRPSGLFGTPASAK